MISGEKEEGWLASQLAFAGAMQTSTSKESLRKTFLLLLSFSFPVMRSWFLPLSSGHLILKATCMQHLQAA